MSKLIITEVSDPLIAKMMQDEHYHLSHEAGEPYRFIGADAATRAIRWQALLETEVPVSLTVREAFFIGRILKECDEYHALFGISGCKDKLTKAVFDKTK